ncbi:DUF397 domain-containing protein [Streptomyces sp. NPDC093252]|uniref:DUF397 domain-containing protein n=1 Tax=Streptomyces sp. NPDC093252 TaxID=3154980 RepID=UPI00341B7CA0
MTPPPKATLWRKSSYSGGSAGNACVEISERTAHISIRDSKTPAGAILTFPTSIFAAFIGTLKPSPPTHPNSHHPRS